MSKQIELTSGNLKQAMSASGSKSRDLWMVPIDQINIIEGFNVRDDNEEYRAHIRMLADSIKANGFFSHKPLVGFIERKGDKNLIRVTDGHSRLAAAKLAISEGCEIATLPMVAHPSGTDMADLIVGLATDNSGKALKPIELAAVCKRLQAYGMEVTEIAKRLAVTVTYVNSLLSLIGAPKVIREMVSKGEVSAATAITTLRKEGDGAAKVLEQAVATAKAAGKTKVAPKALKAAQKPAEAKPAAKPVKALKGDDSDPYVKACKWVFSKYDDGTAEAEACAKLIAHTFGIHIKKVESDIARAV